MISTWRAVLPDVQALQRCPRSRTNRAESSTLSSVHEDMVFPGFSTIAVGKGMVAHAGCATLAVDSGPLGINNDQQCGSGRHRHASSTTRFSSDQRKPGALFANILRWPHGHTRRRGRAGGAFRSPTMQPPLSPSLTSRGRWRADAGNWPRAIIMPGKIEDSRYSSRLQLAAPDGQSAVAPSTWLCWPGFMSSDICVLRRTR